jgi:hypothetical protein
MEEFPKLRQAIDVVPVTKDGRDYLVLHDRMGLSDDLMIERRGGAVLLSLLDGRHSLRDIQVALMRQSGLGLVSMDEIRGIVSTLESHFLLEGESFRRRKQQVHEEFKRSPVRPPSHAGEAYPRDPDELRAQIEDLLKMGSGGSGAQHQQDSMGSRLAGAVLPHIDFSRGGECYGRGYARIRPYLNADLYVILGTSHLPMEHPFAFTSKAFRTPLGVTESASELAHQIKDRAGIDLFEDELVHRTEHTIEFQVVFLQYLLADARAFRVLPVLCGGFHEMMERRLLPGDHEPFRRSLEAVSDVLSKYSGRWCAIASADLAHLGPQFGDPRPVERSELVSIRQADLEMLNEALKGDALRMYRIIMAEGDRRRICGLPPIYTLLQLIVADRGELIHYGQAFHPVTTVTFASLAFWS